MELKRSSLPESVVNKMINNRYKAFADLAKRNPTMEEKQEMSDEIIALAKKINIDRGMQQ